MPGQQRRRLTVPIIVGALLVLGLIAAATRPEWQLHPLNFDMPDSKPSPQSHSEPPHSALPREKDQSNNLSNLAVVGWVLLGLLTATAAAIAWLVIRRLLGLFRPKPSAQLLETSVTAEAESELDVPTMQRGAAAAQRRMSENAVPNDAVISAWLELEQAAAASGVQRQAAETPTEFTAQVLTRTAADHRATQTLLHLYLRARFSNDQLTDDDLQQARRCLHDLATGWNAVSETRADHTATQPPGTTNSTAGS